MEVEAVKRMCYHIIVIKNKELSGGRYQSVYMPLFYEQHRKNISTYLVSEKLGIFY